MANEKYGYSVNEEDYHGLFDSREEALEEGLETYPDEDVIFTAKAVHPSSAQLYPLCADDCIDGANGQLYELCGEHSEGHEIDQTKEQQDDLDDMLQAAFVAWCEKYKMQATCYYVDDVQKHERPASTEGAEHGE